MSLAVICFSISVSGTNLHAVPYLIGIGYAPARAAIVLSSVLAFGAAGKLLIGWIADKIGARVALSANLFAMALGIGLLTGAAHRLPLIGFVVIFGLTVGAPLALIPLVMAGNHWAEALWLIVRTGGPVPYRRRGDRPGRGRPDLRP